MKTAKKSDPFGEQLFDLSLFCSPLYHARLPILPLSVLPHPSRPTRPTLPDPPMVARQVLNDGAWLDTKLGDVLAQLEAFTYICFWQVCPPEPNPNPNPHFFFWQVRCGRISPHCVTCPCSCTHRV